MEKRSGMGNHNQRHGVSHGGPRRGGLSDARKFIEYSFDNSSSGSHRRSRSNESGNSFDTSGTEGLPTWYLWGVTAISLGLILILALQMWG